MLGLGCPGEFSADMCKGFPFEQFCKYPSPTPKEIHLFEDVWRSGARNAKGAFAALLYSILVRS